MCNWRYHVVSAYCESKFVGEYIWQSRVVRTCTRWYKDSPAMARASGVYKMTGTSGDYMWHSRVARANGECKWRVHGGEFMWQSCVAKCFVKGDQTKTTRGGRQIYFFLIGELSKIEPISAPR